MSGEPSREIEALSRSLAEAYEELSVIYRLNEAMSLTADPRAYLQDLAEQLRDLLAAEAILIDLAPRTVPGGEPVTIGAGGLPVAREDLLAALDSDSLSRRGHQVVTVAANRAPPGQARSVQVLASPLQRNGRRLGVIAAVRAGDEPRVNNIDVTRLSSIARSTSMVLENFRLYDNLHQLFLGTVRALIRTIDAKDPYTCGHSERVAGLSRRLLLRMGGAAAQADRIYLCGLLHDIGKIGVPEEVLRKSGRLTDEEFAGIRRHPSVGATILEDIGELDDIVPGVLHHHERVDGRGYPDGLAGEEIPLYARILSVADTFDAMTSSRPYRKALSVAVAIEELRRHAGTQFDPAVVEALIGLGPAAVFEELHRVRDPIPVAIGAERREAYA